MREEKQRLSGPSFFINGGSKVLEIAKNRRIAPGVYEMTLEGDASAITAPGQFVNIRLDGLFLRRPISVCDWGDGWIRIIYKVVGRGTERMAQMQPGAQLDVLTGLGNGYNPAPALGRRIALVGGGVGVPPLFGLARRLAGEKVVCILGFNRADEIFYADEFARYGNVLVATADGSAGVRGFVTDVLRGLEYDYYFACGPEPMLKAVHALGREGQLSFEARMGCGFGACMGCSCETLAGPKRICVEGPVMQSGEVRFA